MTKRKLYLRTIVLPLVIALLGVLLLDGYVHSHTRVATATQPQEQVVITTQSVPAGTALLPSMLTLREVPKSAVTGDQETDVNAVAGKTVMVSLPNGDPVFASELANSTNGTLSYALPAGYDAITIPASEFVAVAGFVEPGDTVDVLAAIQKGSSSTGGTTSLVASDITVVAVQQDRTPGAQPMPLKNLTSVTLQVTPQEGSSIFNDEQSGVLTLMLRSAKDQHVAAAPTGPATNGNTAAAPAK